MCGGPLLHIATDYPGNFANGPEIARLLVAAGADVNARLLGPHAETPLHWAASTDDTVMIDALLDLGADLEAPGSVIDGGGPLSNAAGLGLHARVIDLLGAKPPADTIDLAFWCACQADRRGVAEMLLEHGADVDRAGHAGLAPLDAAAAAGADDMVAWLRAIGAASGGEAPPSV